MLLIFNGERRERRREKKRSKRGEERRDKINEFLFIFVLIIDELDFLLILK